MRLPLTRVGSENLLRSIFPEPDRAARIERKLCDVMGDGDDAVQSAASGDARRHCRLGRFGVERADGESVATRRSPRRSSRRAHPDLQGPAFPA